MNEEDKREMFETAAQAKGYGLQRDQYGYIDPHTHYFEEGWQSALAAMEPS